MKTYGPFASMTPEQLEEHDRRYREEQEARAAKQEGEIRKAMDKAPGVWGVPAKDCALLASGGVASSEAISALDGAPVLLCLSGNPGCGKTVAASSWIWQIAHDRKLWTADMFGGGTRFMPPAPVFVKAARLSRWERYDDDQMEALLRASRLVIDDLGMEFNDSKGNFSALLDEVIDARYDASLPTILTTNLDGDQFKTRYGERIVDRIREIGRFVSLATESMRRKIA